MKWEFFGAIASASLGLAMMPSAASATTTVLDFSGAICGAAGDTACGSGTQIGQNYGDTAGVVDVAYRSINVPGATTHEAFLKYWSSGYGDLSGVVWGGANATGYSAEIVFTPGAGYEVALIGFDSACYQNRPSCQTLNYSVASVGGTAIGANALATNYPTHVAVGINSSYFTDGIVLSWGPDAYDTALDNIAFDVRRIGSGAVPEPASWAMMIGGFALAGGAMRRRAGRRMHPAAA